MKLFRLAVPIILLAMTCSTTIAVAKHSPVNHNSAVPVKLSIVQSKRVQQSINAVGTIVAPEMTQVSSSVSGHIKQILFNNGAKVTAGATLIQLDNATETANLAKAQAKATSSLASYNRAKQLVAQHMLAQQSFDTAKAQYLQDQADVTVAQTALHNRSIDAPFSGTVGEVKVSIGDYINPGQALVNIVGSEALRVDYTLPETALNKVNLGNRVVLHAAIFPKQRITAKLTFIAPDIDTNTHTVACQATIISGDTSLLRSGMFVKVKQYIEQHKTMIFVPEAAVTSFNGRTVIYTLKQGHAVAVPVTIGIHKAGKIQITSGLSSGMKIIVSGQGLLSNNQAVRIIDSTTNSEH